MTTPKTDRETVEALAATCAKRGYVSPPREPESYGASFTCREALDLADTLRALLAERDALREALTPSGATKAAYISEIETDCPQGRSHTVSWTATKDIMAMILARAALKDTEEQT